MAGDLVTPDPKPAPRPKARKRPLPYRSAKRKLEANEREHVRMAVARRQGYRCIAAALGPCRSPHGHRPDLEIHEVKTRGRGGSDLNVNNCVGLCQAHHDWVTEHPREAHAMGLVRNSWEPEPDAPITPDDLTPLPRGTR